MCGIVGFAGKTKCIPIIYSGLEALEYRGYDSAGIAYIYGETASMTDFNNTINC